MTSSNRNIFRVTGFCAANSPVTCEFPAQRPVTQSFDVFFDQTVVQTVVRLVIWDATALTMTSLLCMNVILNSYELWDEIIFPFVTSSFDAGMDD